jgi:hypothetical protein
MPKVRRGPWKPPPPAPAELDKAIVQASKPKWFQKPHEALRSTPAAPRDIRISFDVSPGLWWLLVLAILLLVWLKA